MFKIIPKLLDGKRLHALISTLKTANFADGKLSAGDIAKQVKNNQEAEIERDRLNALNGIVIGAYLHNPDFQQFALPYRMAEPFYARYQAGMYYGEHVDDPVMGTNIRYRSDISTTLFLSDPDEYEGGELSLQTPSGPHTFKLNSGEALVYPSSYLHQVREVIAGERLVAIGWTQSLVRSAEQRQLLSTLSEVRDELHQTGNPTDTAAKVNNCYSNLIRMWSEV